MPWVGRTDCVRTESEWVGFFIAGAFRKMHHPAATIARDYSTVRTTAAEKARRRGAQHETKARTARQPQMLPCGCLRHNDASRCNLAEGYPLHKLSSIRKVPPDAATQMLYPPKSTAKLQGASVKRAGCSHLTSTAAHELKAAADDRSKLDTAAIQKQLAELRAAKLELEAVIKGKGASYHSVVSSAEQRWSSRGQRKPIAAQYPTKRLPIRSVLTEQQMYECTLASAGLKAGALYCMSWRTQAQIGEGASTLRGQPSSVAAIVEAFTRIDANRDMNHVFSDLQTEVKRVLHQTGVRPSSAIRKEEG